MRKTIVCLGIIGIGCLGACEANTQTQQRSQEPVAPQAVATSPAEPKVDTPAPAAPAEPKVETPAPADPKVDKSPPIYRVLPDFGDVASARIYSFSLELSTDSYWANAPEELSYECHQFPVQKDGSTCRKATNSVVLSSKQLKSVLALFTTPGAFGPSRASAGCFNPRHAIGFFNVSGELLAQIDICIECNNLRVTPPIKPMIQAAIKHNYKRPAEGRKYIETAIGHEGLSSFRDLCRQASLDGCDQPTWIDTIND